MQKIIEDEGISGFNKEVHIEELSNYVEKVDIELVRLTDLAALRIEDLTLTLPSFEGSLSSLD